MNSYLARRTSLNGIVTKMLMMMHAQINQFKRTIIVCFMLLALNVHSGKVHAGQTVMNESSTKQLETNFGQSPGGNIVLVNIKQQTLQVVHKGEITRNYPISSSKFGIGNQENSFKTPLGVHRIAQKIGDGATSGTIFKARIDTGKIANILTTDASSTEDYVTSRILWLEGLEQDKNKGDDIDSFQRYIYIHGTAEEGRIGTPASRGCIRMRNADVIELFNLLEVGTLVNIIE